MSPRCAQLEMKPTQNSGIDAVIMTLFHYFCLRKSLSSKLSHTSHNETMVQFYEKTVFYVFIAVLLILFAVAVWKRGTIQSTLCPPQGTNNDISERETELNELLRKTQSVQKKANEVRIELSKNEEIANDIQLDIREICNELGTLPSAGDANANQEYLEVSFKTKGDNVFDSTMQLIDHIMGIPGCKERMHEQESNMINDRESKTTFILKKSLNDEMIDPSMEKILELLQNDNSVKAINLDVVQQSKTLQNKVSHAGEMREYELSFKTEGNAVKAYSNELLDKLKVNEEDISCHMIDNQQAVIRVSHCGDDSNKNEALVEVLQNEKRVSSINLNARQIDDDIHDKSSQKTTRYVGLSFKTNGFEVASYSCHLINAMKINIEGFKKKVVEQNVNVIKYGRAEIVLILKQCESDLMDDPAIAEACNLLQYEQRVTDIKINVVEPLVPPKKLLNGAKMMKDLKQLKTKKKVIQATLLAFETFG